MVALLTAVAARAVHAGEISIGLYTRETTKSPAEVVEDLEFAITERNFRVTGVLHVGRGIRERGADAFPDYDVILFCSLSLARKMLEQDPGYINFCPGRITVRGGDQTVISAPLLPASPANPLLTHLVEDINVQIRQIVDYGTEPWSPPAAGYKE